MTPEGTFVRAITESSSSVYMSDKKGRTALTDKGYPGIERAENHVWGTMLDIGGDPAISPYVGTDYYEVVDFRRDGDRYVATVCNYSSLTAHRGRAGTRIGPTLTEREGTYISRGSLPGGVTQAYIFGPDPSLTPAQQRAPLAQQRGPARRPTDNVFGTWLLFEQPRVSDEQVRVCNKLAPGTPTDWPDPYMRTEPPPTLPPDPGWPDGSSA
ncbi:hypothetical protein [Mycobacteroides abscessus]|uniref:hypothetical protein n=1 Tax=Mycobacteroides abscessus TaxID=36809 RepID=UPI001F2555BC|nr:hypothetical protein [Mycobacteroides abscessus]